MATRWRVKPFARDAIEALVAGAGVSSLLAQVLINRGHSDPALVRTFLQARLNDLHDPALLPGATEAAGRIVQAVRDGRRIVIYGDYDVDGVCGTSILWACLKLAGARDVDYYIPHRVDEGYGVNPDALRKIASEMKADLVITVDCGISAVAEAGLARELGLRLIITDHHTPGEVLPDAEVVVHPRIHGACYPCPDLCGAAVAFKLAWQICKGFGDGKKASPQLRDFLVRSLGLVALATVADVVPIVGENRIFVRHGLEGIDAQPTVGLRALMEVAGCLGKKKLTAGTVGFNLGPRINAAGRLTQARRAVEMLTTDDDILAREIANELDASNTERQEIEQTIVREAHELIRAAGDVGSRGAIVVGREGWHPGVIGIVASRIAETYHRPAIVVAINDGHCQGSARSVPGFNLYDAIKACSEGLLSFGGHAAAAGLKMHHGHFPIFAERFDAHCRDALTVEQRERVLHVDAEVLLGTLTFKVIQELESLEPFGIGNARPLLISSGVRFVGEPRIVGARKNHVQLRVAQGDVLVKAIGWNLADKFKAVVDGAAGAVAFHVAINEWNGRREVQLEVRDFKLDGVEDEPAPARPHEQVPEPSGSF